ncbi:MAG: hypothetical protein LBI43_00380 [Streptococcaceae bacterium]|jgi:OPA family glycerol-3-phosphate transporter-like MFS transporter|nr:hypothetical protein [Streptococcaceae bacterium]
MVNEAVPKFANGMSTGSMGFFQYILGEKGATIALGWIVQKAGWGAGNIVVYSFAGLAIVLSIYILIRQNRLIKQVDELEAGEIEAEQE